MIYGSINFINYEEITTAIMDVVMPNRDKTAEMGKQLKMINILAEKLLSRYLDDAVNRIVKNNPDKIFVLWHTDKESVEMSYAMERFEPATLARIYYVTNYDDEKQSKDDTFIYPEDYEKIWKYDLYPGYHVDDEPKTDVDREIITRLKFIKENKLDEVYDKICGIYFYEFMKYANKCMTDETMDIKDFRRMNRVRPNFIITPEINFAGNTIIKILDRC